MENPDIQCCPNPKCGTPKWDLQRQVHVKRDEFGVSKMCGWFWTCTCGALTRSPQTGKLNLKDKVAKKFGIKKREMKVAIFVPPLIRRTK